MKERLLVHPLAVEAAHGGGGRAQALESDVSAAIDASAVLAPGDARERCVQLPQLEKVARRLEKEGYRLLGISEK